MKIEKFEDLQVWKEARVFVRDIYHVCNQDPLKKDYGFRDQIQRAAVSITANIAEGFERNNNKEFIKFLGYAKGSAGEVRALLYVALDLNYLSQEQFYQNYDSAVSISKQISSFIKYLKNYQQ